MKPPRRRRTPTPQRTMPHAQRAFQYRASDAALIAMGGFQGKERIDKALLKRQAGLPGAIEHSNGGRSPNAQQYYAAVLHAFNGDRTAAARYLEAFRQALKNSK